MRRGVWRRLGWFGEWIGRWVVSEGGRGRGIKIEIETGIGIGIGRVTVIVIVDEDIMGSIEPAMEIGEGYSVEVENLPL